MKKNELTAKELEAQIKQKIEVENKDELNALKAKQQAELKALKAELAKKKRQELAKTIDEVGKHFIRKFDVEGHHNSDMTADDYKKEIDAMFAFYQSHSKGQQEF